MSVAALTMYKLGVNMQIHDTEEKKIHMEDLMEANSKQLKEQETAEDKWTSASDKVEEVWDDPSSSLIYKNVTYWNKGHSSFRNKYSAATAYANAKVPKFNKEKLEEYTDLDMEYSTMVNMYETLLTELDAADESTKSRLEKESGDSHIIGGG